MAFCAKCGTPLNDAGVCPNCGYVLPQNKRPVQSEPVPGVNNGVQDNPVNSQTDPGVHSPADYGNVNPAQSGSVPGGVQMNQSGPQMGGVGPQGQPYYGGPQNGNPAGGPQQPYSNTAPGYGSAPYGSGAQNGGYGAGAQMGGYNNNMGGQAYGGGQMGPNGPQMGPNGPQMGQQNGPQGQPYYGMSGNGPQGQPYYGQMPPRQPSEFGNNLLQWFLGIFKKDPTEVFDKAGNSKSPVWAVYMAVYAFFGALSLACSVGSILQIFGDFGDIWALEELYDRASVQCAFVSFFGAFLFYVAIMFLTSLTVWLLMIILGKKIPFWSACNVTVVAYIPVILATVFSFICSFTVVTGFIAAFVSSVASIATMILLYCGITRLADHKKSALWPYVIAQAALKLVTIIIAVIFIFVCLMILSAMLAAFVSRW